MSDLDPALSHAHTGETLRQAIVLSAGLGTRMRPLTLSTPKPLIHVAGQCLLDHALEIAFRSGIETAAVNAHYLADQIEDHLARHHSGRVLVSDERTALLDSGGGVAKALDQLKNEPTLLLNADSFWIDRAKPAVMRLASQFDPHDMDFLLLLAKHEDAVGFGGAGDFFMDQTGRLKRRGAAASAPYVYTGAAVLHPKLFAGRSGDVFSLNTLFDEAIAHDRLSGIVLDGLWLHVGTPGAIKDAEDAIHAFKLRPRGALGAEDEIEGRG